MAPRKSLTVRPLSVLVVTFLNASPAVCAFGVAVGAGGWAQATAPAATASISRLDQSFMVILSSILVGILTVIQYSLLFPKVDAVFFVFIAEAFEDVGVGQQIMGDFDGKRFGIHRWIVEGHFDIQVSEVAAVEALGYAQRFAVRVAHQIQTGFIVEAGGFDNEYIALPMADGVTQVGGKVEFLGQRAAIGIDLAV